MKRNFKKILLMIAIIISLSLCIITNSDASDYNMFGFDPNTVSEFNTDDYNLTAYVNFTINAPDGIYRDFYIEIHDMYDSIVAISELNETEFELGPGDYTAVMMDYEGGYYIDSTDIHVVYIGQEYIDPNQNGTIPPAPEHNYDYYISNKDSIQSEYSEPQSVNIQVTAPSIDWKLVVYNSVTEESVEYNSDGMSDNIDVYLDCGTNSIVLKSSIEEWMEYDSFDVRVLDSNWESDTYINAELAVQELRDNGIFVNHVTSEDIINAVIGKLSEYGVEAYSTGECTIHKYSISSLNITYGEFGFKIGEKEYKMLFEAINVLLNGTWIEENGNKYYRDIDGNNITGIQKIGNDIYYFGDDGKMKTNYLLNNLYYFGSDGRRVEDQLVYIDGYYYYFIEDDAFMATDV